MKILALAADTDKTDPIPDVTLDEEAHHVWRLRQDGTLREIYFRSYRRDAVLILECDSIDAASKIIASLPLVRDEWITFELIGLHPYDGFERLFREP